MLSLKWSVKKEKGPLRGPNLSIISLEFGIDYAPFEA
jgi:hypothetical protein